MTLRPIDSDQPGTRPVKKGTRCVTGWFLVAWEKGDDVCGGDKLFYWPQSDRISLLVKFVLLKRRA